MDKLLAMEVFVQVVDAGGVTRAAENLQMPKATVSTLLQKLEGALGAKLLNRTTRKISVTADGAAYYERCIRILSDVRDSEESLSNSQRAPGGRLRVEMSTLLASTVIIPALPDFFARYPDLILDIGSSDRSVDLIAEGVDCALRGGILHDSTLIARRVGSLHFGIAASPEYLARHPPIRHPRDLLQHQAITFFSSRNGKVYQWQFQRGNEKIELDITARLSMNNTDSCALAVMAGLGVAQLPRLAFQSGIDSGRLAWVLDDWTREVAPLHIVYPHNRHLSAKVRVFVEWVAQLLAAQPELAFGPAYA